MTDRAKPSVTMDRALYEEYRKILPGLGMKFSTRIEYLVREDLIKIRPKKENPVERIKLNPKLL